MKFPQPIIALTWRVHTENRRLRRDLEEARAELAVAKCREKRWRRHAFLLSKGDEKAEWACAAQAWSDDWADAPEVERRNTFPRSLP